MKNKKLIIGLGLGVGAYLLWSLNRKKSTGVVEEAIETVESTTQTGETKTYFKTKDGKVLQCAKGYTGGTKENPTLYSCNPTGGVKQSSSKLTNEQVVALFKRANNYYRGGARPTQELIDRINKDRMLALKEVEQRGLTSGFKSWKSGEDAKNKLTLSPPMTFKTGGVGGLVIIDKKLSTMPYGNPVMLGSIRM